MNDSIRKGVRGFVSTAGPAKTMTFGAVAISAAFECATKAVAGAWASPVLLFFPIVMAMGTLRVWLARSPIATVIGAAGLALAASELLALSAGWIARSERTEAALWAGLGVGMGWWFWRAFERARAAREASDHGRG